MKKTPPLGRAHGGKHLPSTIDTTVCPYPCPHVLFRPSTAPSPAVCCYFGNFSRLSSVLSVPSLVPAADLCIPCPCTVIAIIYQHMSHTPTTDFHGLLIFIFIFGFVYIYEQTSSSISMPILFLVNAICLLAVLSLCSLGGTSVLNLEESWASNQSDDVRLREEESKRERKRSVCLQEMKVNESNATEHRFVYSQQLGCARYSYHDIV